MSQDRSQSGSLRSRARRGVARGRASSAAHGEVAGMEAETSWRRILLLIIAITVHNIPGPVCVCMWCNVIGVEES